MPKQSRRRQAITQLVRERGFMSVDDLAHAFEVTPQTIRRDINTLCQDGPLQRYHGGVGYDRRDQALGKETAGHSQARARLEIGRLVAAHIPDEASLFIAYDVTTQAVAAALANHRGLRIVTNSLEVARTLAHKDDFELTLTGGVIRPRQNCLVGEPAMEMIAQFRVDTAIVGVSAIDADGALLHCDYQAARLAQAMMANAGKVFLVAEQSKFECRALASLGSLGDVSALFTDRKPSASVAQLLSRWQLSVCHPNAEPADLCQE